MLQLIEAANMHDVLTTSATDPQYSVSAPLITEIFNTIEAGHVPVIPPLIFPQNIRNLDGETLLIVAARCGHANVVREFRNIIDVDEIDNDGWSALLCAAHKGHDDCARLLLEVNASVDQSDFMGWTPLMWSCYKNRLETTKVLLEFHAHINIVGEEDGLTPLIIASGRGYADIVHCLIENGAEVNSSDKFGSTALIWASRKGYLNIVEELLNAGADLDAIGMYSSTALMLSTRGCHLKVVEVLISRDPNVNVVDYNGLSALGIAAREGYTEIAQLLIQSGAYVNMVDRFGNSILASAVRSGNIHLIRMLLDKHADVNAKDSESRTPLHLAIDKAYTDIVLALLEKKPNLEQKNKDGDTALLRAVKNRDIALCQLLVHSGAKISATDNAGDNSLHLALRARSKRLAQILLVNPGDSKLLYRPNKLGETPYSIDQDGPSPILPTIFGPIGVDMDLKNLLGYDVYSDVLADIVCEPNLSLPLTVGLYAKWGSGKSFLLPRMRESMKSFSRSWLDGMELYWSWTLVFVCFAMCAFLSFIVFVLNMVITESPEYVYPLTIGVSIYSLLIASYGFVYYGSDVRLWNGSITVARHIAKTLARIKLVFSVFTLQAPMRTDKDMIVSPVCFLFADDHRLSFVGGEQALANIVLSLYNAAEEHYGAIAVRLFSAFHSQTQPTSKLRTLCGIPILIYLMVMMGSFIIALILVTQYYASNSISSYLISASVFGAVCLICAMPSLYVFTVRLIFNLPQQRIKQMTQRANGVPFERLVQKLQKEVDLLTSLIHSLDAFTNSQTRLVIMIDGLDSCESTNMIQILDALSLFFGSRQNAPYIVIIAADPHIIVSALQNSSLRSTGINYEITGHDYMKNVISMPFYLHHSSLQQLQRRLQNKSQPANGGWLDRKRSDTRGSRLSLREKEMLSSSTHVGTKENLVNTFVTSEFGNLFPSHDYFSNMNPRLMRRIVNSIALTGRLLRSFEIEFSWFMLYTWISLLEQWPFRMTFLVDSALDSGEDTTSISELYERIRNRLPTKSTLLELDRSPAEFDVVMKRMLSTKNEQLTIGHVKIFSACTSNLDPYLKKIIHEQVVGEHGDPHAAHIEDSSNQFVEMLSGAQFLFEDQNVWKSIVRPLPRMSAEEICALIKYLSIPADRLEKIIHTLMENNLNGLALQSCEMNDLREVLKVPLGDWSLIKLLVEALRIWKPLTKRWPSHEPSMSRNTRINRAASMAASEEPNLMSISEERAIPMRDDSDELQSRSEIHGIAHSDDEDDDENDECSLKSNAGSKESLLKATTSHHGS